MSRGGKKKKHPFWQFFFFLFASTKVKDFHFFFLTLSWKKLKDEVTWLNLNFVRWCHEVPSYVLIRLQNESSINYLSDILMEDRIFFKSWNFHFESMLTIKVYKLYLFSCCKKFIWSPVYDFGILLHLDWDLYLSTFLRWGVATILHSIWIVVLIFIVTFTTFWLLYSPAFFRWYFLEFQTEPYAEICRWHLHILDHVNSIRLSIQFTRENKLAFLDVLIAQIKHGFKTSV